MKEMMKAVASRTLVIKINLIFLAFFLVLYLALLLQPSSVYQRRVASIVPCTLHNCHVNEIEDGRGEKTERMVKKVIPSFFNKLHGNNSIALVNIREDELLDWKDLGATTLIKFERVSENFEWKAIFPGWIDEEKNERPSCPEVPMPDFSLYDEFDAVVVRLPCRRPEPGWSRDVFRLQVHLITANLAVTRVKRDSREMVKLVFYSSCRPMMDVFRCDDMVDREGKWWMYEVEVRRLEEKVAMPIGSCKLALPLWTKGTINKEFDESKLVGSSVISGRREAYATVIHSSDAYVCGAIMLAQSIKKTGSTRDLILLHDKSIPEAKLQALTLAGWQLRQIDRIRNPHTKRHTYNEYNYSKFRVWLLTDYDKVVFIDADIIVLRNLDLLFSLPQISASGNNRFIFNSGIMVLEPSSCTFNTLMKNRKEITSYNGGDQGFLNEIFVWWHRLPKRVNFLKYFWSNKTADITMINQLIASDPPKLYSIHYLGSKPWLCYKDYDCNWNVKYRKIFANDFAHRIWWNVHDQTDEGLKGFCRLTKERKERLEKERKNAEKLGFTDGHWKINITDRRRNMRD